MFFLFLISWDDSFISVVFSTLAMDLVHPSEVKARALNNVAPFDFGGTGGADEDSLSGFDKNGFIAQIETSARIEILFVVLLSP